MAELDGNSDMVDIWTTITRNEHTSLMKDIITALENHHHQFFDAIGAVHTLEVKGIFPPRFCKNLLQIVSNPNSQNTSREKLQILVLLIFQKESIVQPCEILDLIGLSDLAEDIHIEHNGPIQRQIRRATIPHSEELQVHFYDMKSLIDNVYPPERLNLLTNDTNNLKRSFHNIEDENELTRAANMFAVDAWLLVQHCQRDTQKIRKVLYDMRTRSWPAGVHQILAEIVFESKMAVVATMECSFEFAKLHRRNAKFLAREYHDPLSKALVCHDSKYVSQALKRNNVEDNSSVMRECQNGLQFLESESSDNHFCVQMQRLFLLNIAQEHLYIGNDLQIDHTAPILPEELEYAVNVMFAANLNMMTGQPVERRREMVFKVCMARLHDRQGHLDTAKAYLGDAERLSNDGAFFEEEKRNIHRYKAILDRA